VIENTRKTGNNMDVCDVDGGHKITKISSPMTDGHFSAHEFSESKLFSFPPQPE
jgi:hypothetical protein